MPDQTVPAADAAPDAPRWRTRLAGVRGHVLDAGLAIVSGAALVAAYTVESDLTAYALAALAVTAGSALTIRHREETSR